MTDRQQPLLFEFARPLDDLADMLLEEYARRRMSMKQIYEQHHIGRPYIKSNYKDVLRNLENQGKIITDRGILLNKDLIYGCFPRGWPIL